MNSNWGMTSKEVVGIFFLGSNNDLKLNVVMLMHVCKHSEISGS